MLQEFGPNIWVAEGSNVQAAAGFHYPTRMAAIRLANGDLVVWSPTMLNENLRAAVEALGPVQYLVPPNSLHHTFLKDWQQAFPRATLMAPPGLRARRQDIRFDADFSDGGVTAWDGEIDVEIVWGNRITTEVVFFHRESRTAIFADLIQHLPPGWFSGWRAIVARLDLMVSDQPEVPRKFRVAFTDRDAARQSLSRILAWPTQKVIIAHGSPVTENGQTPLKRAFRWLE